VIMPLLKIKKSLYISAGLLLSFVGLAGVFIPLLPTTPFVLAAAYCFLRSSDYLYKKLITHKILGKYIDNYLNHKSMTMKSKVIVIIFLWCSMGISIVAVKSLHLTLLLIFVGLCVTTHLLLLKTYVPEKINSEGLFRQS